MIELSFAIIVGFMLFTPSDYNLVETEQIHNRNVVWLKQVPADCGDPKRVVGCASRYASLNLCVIEMAGDSPDWVIAHEFKHCFGFEHNSRGSVSIASKIEETSDAAATSE